MLQDPLADALIVIKNAERSGKKECVIKTNKLIGSVLKVIQENGYIDSFELIEDGKGNKFNVVLKGKIIDTKVIKPRFSVKVDEFEKWEKRFLPARNIGLLIMSTPKGIIGHTKAKEIGTGGKLLCYIY